MPLQHNSSEAAFKSNVAAELAAKKSLDQALAIAYQIKRNDDIAKVKHLVGKIARGDCADSVRNDADFKESDHPRAEDGKFGSGSVSHQTKIAPDKKLSKEESFAKSISSKSESDQTHFKAAKQDGVSIPPAWTNVSYNGKTGKDGIVARGTDAKGRKQVIEDPEYRLAKIAEKQARIEKNLSSKMPEIQQQLKSMATEGNENAKVLYLITQTGFRVGGEGDGAARVKAYGASTLMGEHVKVEGNKTTFDFIGKEGVRQFHEVNDPIIASMCKNAKPGEKLFNTNDAKIRKEWKKLGGEKVHDIRSYVATQDARKEISKLIPPVPKDEKEMSKIKMQVATVVAKKLGNKPIESLRTYINPNVFMVK